MEVNRAKKFGTCVFLIIVVLYGYLLYGCLLSETGRELDVPMFVLVTGLIVICLSSLVCLSKQSTDLFSAGTILFTALIIRLVFVFSEPCLSDDIYRYVLDGRMTITGKNPYALSPAHAAKAYPGIAGIAAKVNHPDLVTLYPPAAQLVFAAGVAAGRVTGGVAGMKLVLSLMDTVTCLLIILLLRRYRLPLTCAILYAWHPLTVLETGGSGHIDAAAVFFLFLTLFLVKRADPVKHDWNQQLPVNAEMPCRSGFRPTMMSGKSPTYSSVAGNSRISVFDHRGLLARNTLAGAMFGAAFLTKLMPMIFLPVIIMMKNVRKTAFIAGFVLFCFFITVPFLSNIGNGIETVGEYAGHWEFAGAFYRIFRSVTGSGITARMISALFFILIAIAIFMKFRKDPSDPMKSLYWITMAFLLLSPTLHPWYALYLAAFLPFCAGPSGLVFSWSVLLSYSVMIPFTLTGQWVENSLSTVLVTAGPVLAAVVSIPFTARR